jgi:hypothetical protein
MGMRCTSAFVTKITCDGHRWKISVFKGKRYPAPRLGGEFRKSMATPVADNHRAAMMKGTGFERIGPGSEEIPAG